MVIYLPGDQRQPVAEAMPSFDELVPREIVIGDEETVDSLDQVAPHNGFDFARAIGAAKRGGVP